ncbi:MAG: thioredoxin domain-containing protein [Planctomycetota bacterium]
MLTGLLVASFGCQQSASSRDDDAPGEAFRAGHEPDEPKRHANRLADETSPYLLLHAHNPVDWHPWGPEALAKAKDEGKLIFLSVGYSSCYWCHVMERESFMDQEIAAFMNEHFVAIKVDREERPDIDEIYMTALGVYFQAVGSPQSGGWPMSMFLTPDAEPVGGGTYYPPRDRGGMSGFLTVLKRVQQGWEENPDGIARSGRRLAEVVKEHLRGLPASAKLDATAPEAVLRALAAQFDPEFGGFGYSQVNPRMPKFPEPSNLWLLLDRARRARARADGDPSAEQMLTATLDGMAAGGIRDHLGGGFHRYSTDRFWRIPHFEKMLYDNAQLASVYAEAYHLFGNDDYRRVVDGIATFVLRELKAPEGGFHSALDAETEEEEGRYYAWDRQELAAVLNESELGLFAEVYGVGPRGNFEGRHVPLLPRPVAEAATERGRSQEDLRRELVAIRKKLLAARGKRQRPLTDTKVLTAWNGLMIRGFADAGRLVEEPRYVEAAEGAATFVLHNLRTRDGRLLRTFSGGQAKLNAYLDDYAFLIDGLIALHEATGRKTWLHEADALMQLQIDLFWDDDGGGFFFTSDDHETLIARSKDPADSALPSGNAVAAGNLVYLAGALDKPEYLDRAEKTFQAFGSLMERAPTAVPRMAVSLAAFLDARKPPAADRPESAVNGKGETAPPKKRPAS